MARRPFTFLRLWAAALGVTIALFAIALLIGSSTAAAADTCTPNAAGDVTICTGAFADGATYLIEVPAPGEDGTARWNGTLLLYSHGIVQPGSPNPAVDTLAGTSGIRTRQWLLGEGYALAGSSYATTGWAVKEALPDQIATLDTFDSLIGAPSQTIAWGHSLGGMITAGLLQRYPERLTAALPMCGHLGGAVGVWNQGLDFAFAIQQLLGGPNTGLQVVNISNPAANLTLALQLLSNGQATPQGKARIALAAALDNIPGWFSQSSPEPAPTDFAAQEANQYKWASTAASQAAFALRAELEQRAGGNPSWNTGVNYERQLEKSGDLAEVEALYAAAGLSLEADLATLNAAPRISADQNAVKYLTENIVFNGDLGGRPVLTLHTTGDGNAVNENEQAYRAVVLHAHNSQLLREVFVRRGFHCTFSAGEMISAIHALVQRIDTGKWAESTEPDALNAFASTLGPFYNSSALNPASPSFVEFDPTPFLRPYYLEAP